MKENLYYLFASGLILGSGPCLSFCAPVLISYIASRQANIKKSLISYLVFSIFKLAGYGILGLICGAGITLLQGPLLAGRLDFIRLILGSFIILVGLAILFQKEKGIGRTCLWLNKGNVKNVGVLGLLTGLAPCAPLIGILNYVLIISSQPLEAVMFTLVFGLGTVLSPLIILIMLSGKFSEFASKNQKFKAVLKAVCGIVIISLGLKIVFSYI